VHHDELRRRLGRLTLVVGLAFALTGCAQGVSEHDRGGLRLLTADGPQPGDQALVRGSVALTPEGCVGIQGADGLLHAVVWPAGSYLTDDDTVVAPGLGELSIGNDVSGTGGYYKQDDTLSELARSCKASKEVIRIR
jgi:hypothetical protein